MKQVVMFDPSPISRELIKEKLMEFNVAVEIVQGHRDSFTKLLSLLPDLVIIDVDDNFAGVLDFLKRKKTNPNTTSISVVIVGPAISSERIVTLLSLGINKYFARPFGFDDFVKSIGSLLHVPVQLDNSPSIIDVHKNNHNLVVEVSLSLNLEKISLLKYYLTEIITNHDIIHPKILLILSNIHLNFVDGFNLEKLLDAIISVPRIEKKEIRILTNSIFCKQLVAGHQEYNEIQVEDDIKKLAGSFIDAATDYNFHEVLTGQLLAADKLLRPCNVSLHFNSDIEFHKQRRKGNT